MIAFSRVAFSEWSELVRIPFIAPRASRLPDDSLFSRRSFAAGATVLIAAGAMMPGVAAAGDAMSGKTFHASAAAIAPFLPTAKGEWYNHLGHFASRPERVAAFESRIPATTQLAELTVELPAAKAAPPPGAAPAIGIAPVVPKQASAAAILAFADPSPKAEGGALAAIRSMDSSDEMTGDGIDLGALDIKDVPVPVARPQIEEPAAPPAAKAAVAEPRTVPLPTGDALPASKGTASAPAAVPSPSKEAPPATKAIASLPPAAPIQEAPAEVEKAPSGGFFRKLFGGGNSSAAPRAGNKVAVYDISAAKVYMPDGSVLEAHSGIGEMADNPRYVHVRMNGPTPPQTYDLRMRESRFHGVEAVRMLPVGNQTMHGRTGILTHSYLLRGRAGQSHGCVAFKDYNKFLTAFKKGHVKRIVVVPGGGKAAFARNNSRPGDDA